MFLNDGRAYDALAYFKADGFFPGYYAEGNVRVLFVGRESRYASGGDKIAAGIANTATLYDFRLDGTAVRLLDTYHFSCRGGDGDLFYTSVATLLLNKKPVALPTRPAFAVIWLLSCAP